MITLSSRAPLSREAMLADAVRKTPYDWPGFFRRYLDSFHNVFATEQRWTYTLIALCRIFADICAREGYIYEENRR